MQPASYVLQDLKNKRKVAKKTKICPHHSPRTKSQSELKPKQQHPSWVGSRRLLVPQQPKPDFPLSVCGKGHGRSQSQAGSGEGLGAGERNVRIKCKSKGSEGRDSTRSQACPGLLSPGATLSCTTAPLPCILTVYCCHHCPETMPQVHHSGKDQTHWRAQSKQEKNTQGSLH